MIFFFSVSLIFFIFLVSFYSYEKQKNTVAHISSVFHIWFFSVYKRLYPLLTLFKVFFFWLSFSVFLSFLPCSCYSFSMIFLSIPFSIFSHEEYRDNACTVICTYTCVEFILNTLQTERRREEQENTRMCRGPFRCIAPNKQYSEKAFGRFVCFLSFPFVVLLLHMHVRTPLYRHTHNMK